jgi:diacylglycerol kinase (ATP)
MNNNNNFTFTKRLKSFHYAIHGISFMLRTQHNAWLHLAISIAVVTAAFSLGINLNDWRWIITAMALVWFAETINTAFEFVCDVVSPELHHSVKKAKDIAAGAVLICAIGAALLGGATFWPYLSKTM